MHAFISDAAASTARWRPSGRLAVPHPRPRNLVSRRFTWTTSAYPRPLLGTRGALAGGSVALTSARRRRSAGFPLRGSSPAQSPCPSSSTATRTSVPDHPRVALPRLTTRAPPTLSCSADPAPASAGTRRRHRAVAREGTLRRNRIPGIKCGDHGPTVPSSHGPRNGGGVGAELRGALASVGPGVE